jgi:hypothetical protein
MKTMVSTSLTMSKTNLSNIQKRMGTQITSGSRSKRWKRDGPGILRYITKMAHESESFPIPDLQGNMSALINSKLHGTPKKHQMARQLWHRNRVWDANTSSNNSHFPNSPMIPTRTKMNTMRRTRNIKRHNCTVWTLETSTINTNLHI